MDSIHLDTVTKSIFCNRINFKYDLSACIIVNEWR